MGCGGCLVGTGSPEVGSLEQREAERSPLKKTIFFCPSGSYGDKLELGPDQPKPLLSPYEQTRNIYWSLW